MKLGYIADNLGYEVIGNEDFNVEGISYHDTALKNELAITFSLNDINNTNAIAILTERHNGIDGKYVIRCPYGMIGMAMTKIANLFICDGKYQNYNVPPCYHLNSSGYFQGFDVKIGLNSCISPFATIGDNVKIGSNCFIGTNVSIGSDVCIGDNVTIQSGARIGTNSFYYYEDENHITQTFSGIGSVILDNNVYIGYNSVVQRGSFSNTYIGQGSIVGNLVDIAHDVRIGSNCRIVSQTAIAGSVKINDNVKIYGQVGVANNIEIGSDVSVMAKTLVTKDIKPNSTISGLYGRDHSMEMKIRAKLIRLLRQFK